MFYFLFILVSHMCRQRTTNAEPGNKRTRGGEPEEDPFDARHSEEALQNVNQVHKQMVRDFLVARTLNTA